MKRHLKNLIAAATIGAVLSACGGSSDPAGAIAQTTESASGAVTGFGSVIVEGERYEDTGAQVLNEVDATDPQNAALTDIKLGMQVDVQAADGLAQRVTIRAEVIATVDSLTATGFVLAGQTVEVDDNTVYEGAGGLTDLAVGDYLEVHGQRNDADVIVASRVERRDPDVSRIWRIVGTARAVDREARQFQISNLTIGWDDDTRIAPSAAAIVDGARVAVYGNTAPTGGVLMARAIRVRDAIDIDVRIRVAGFIRNLDFAAKTFNIRRFAVDASSASYVNGTENDLANRRYVRVIGTVQRADDGSRVIMARTVTYRGDFDDQTQVTGPISNFVDAGSFVVRGVPVNASGDDVRFVGGDATNLADGVIVRVVGDVSGNVLVASGVEFVTTDLSDRRSVTGLVRNYDEQAGSFSLHGVAMQLSGDTIYEFGDGSAASVADLNDGELVRAIGAAEAGIFQVAKLIIRQGPSVVIDRIDGAIYNIDITRGIFQLNGRIVRLDNTISVDWVRENLRNGTRVQVSGELNSGELVVRTVEIVRTNGQ